MENLCFENLVFARPVKLFLYFKGNIILQGKGFVLRISDLIYFSWAKKPDSVYFGMGSYLDRSDGFFTDNQF